MKRLIQASCVSLLALTAAALPFSPCLAVGVATTAPKQQDLSIMLKQAMPAVVNVSVQGETATLINPFARDRQQLQPQQPLSKRFESFGSGVIVDAKRGYILTNAHVIHDAKVITITLADGRLYHAKLIGEDVASDIAVLAIKADNLTAMHLGNSDELQVGQPVAAIGNPFNFNQTVTSGIISALQRTDLHLETLEDFIQTDAPINPGNSGGALVDMAGNLIGINTAIYAPEGGSVGIGFAIPANMARSVMEQLIQFGQVRRGMLGIIVQTLTPDLATAFNSLTPKLAQTLNNSEIQGAVVDSVVPNSPAEKAGIKIGDIIRKINGKTIKTGAEIKNTVGLLQIGANLNIDVLRDGKLLTLHSVVIDPKEQEKLEAQKKQLLSGLTLQDITVQEPLHGYVEGVLIVDVNEDSTAWHRGLRAGDVIVSANLKSVHDINALNDIAKQSQKELLLNIHRGPFAQFVVIK
jgi:serine protease Do